MCGTQGSQKGCITALSTPEPFHLSPQVLSTTRWTKKSAVEMSLMLSFCGRTLQTHPIVLAIPVDLHLTSCSPRCPPYPSSPAPLSLTGSTSYSPSHSQSSHWAKNPFIAQPLFLSLSHLVLTDFCQFQMTPCLLQPSQRWLFPLSYATWDTCYMPALFLAL